MLRTPPDIRLLGGIPQFRGLNRTELAEVRRHGSFLDRAPGQGIGRLHGGNGQTVLILAGVVTGGCGPRRHFRGGDQFGPEHTGDRADALVAATAVTLFVMSRHELRVLADRCPRAFARVAGRLRSAPSDAELAERTHRVPRRSVPESDSSVRV